MKNISLILFLHLLAFPVFAEAQDEFLDLSRSGFVITVINFEDGDKIKLFDNISGDHILTKTTDELDLSLMDVGEYLLENNRDKSIIFKKTEEDIYVDIVGDGEFTLLMNDGEESEQDLEAATNAAFEEALAVSGENAYQEPESQLVYDDDIHYDQDGNIISTNEDSEMDENSPFNEQYMDLVPFYPHSDAELLEITREGNIITVVNFEDGDKIKLFEVEDIVHVLTKTTPIIDMTQLPEGLYFLENLEGASVIIKKTPETDNIVDMD